jgi:hypothetical protein
MNINLDDPRVRRSDIDVAGITADPALRGRATLLRTVAGTLRALGYPDDWQEARLGRQAGFLAGLCGLPSCSWDDMDAWLLLAVEIGDVLATTSRTGLTAAAIQSARDAAWVRGYAPPAAYTARYERIRGAARRPDLRDRQAIRSRQDRVRVRIETIRDLLVSQQVTRDVAARHGVSRRSLERWLGILGIALDVIQHGVGPDYRGIGKATVRPKPGREHVVDAVIEACAAVQPGGDTDPVAAWADLVAIAQGDGRDVAA